MNIEAALVLAAAVSSLLAGGLLLGRYVFPHPPPALSGVPMHDTSTTSAQLREALAENDRLRYFVRACAGLDQPNGCHWPGGGVYSLPAVAQRAREVLA